MTFPTSTHVGRLYVESRHRPATQGGGGDIHDVMATPFGVRLLVGDVMGHGEPANRTGLAVLNAWRDLAFTEPSLAGVARPAARPDRPVGAPGAVRHRAAGQLPRPGTAARRRAPGRRRLGRAGLLRAPAAHAAARRVGGVRDAVRRAAARPARPGRRVVPGEHDPGRRRRPAAPVHRRRFRREGRGRAGTSRWRRSRPRLCVPPRRAGPLGLTCSTRLSRSSPPGGARRRPGLRRHSPAARDDALTVGRLITCLISRQAVPTRGEDGMSLGLTRQRPGELPLEVTPLRRAPP